ncbi:MAG: cyanophycin synthetase [Deltaproteobacteria bacterium]|nr:cyanophycin synthetase [Deltaproteobacteria bacterium]
MKLQSTRALRGPNRWSLATVLELEVEIEAGDRIDPRALEARLTDLPLPAPDPRLPADAALPQLLLQIVQGLLTVAEAGGPLHRVVPTHVAGKFKLVVEYREEDVARAAVQAAVGLLEQLRQGQVVELAPIIKELRAQDENLRLGPSTGSIVRAAVAQGIPVRRLNTGSLVQLGWGAKQHRILAAETDRTSAIAETIAQDKELTKQLLRAVGVPVPKGRRVDSAEDAWVAAQELGGPVVVKPQYGNQGRGVAVNLTTKEQVYAAYAAAIKQESTILVEQFKSGGDHRLLVVGERLIAAARRDPPQVTGDGVRTIEALVAEVNQDPRRGEDHATSLSKLVLDEIAKGVLAEQGLAVDGVPAPGQRVLLRRNANLSTGGSATDVTDRVHPEVAARAVEAAKVVGLDIAGVDVVCADPSVPLEQQGGAVLEVNAAPGLRMHLEPSYGPSRPVGEAIIRLMFAPQDDGRIPLVAVTGTNGKTTTTRLVGHIFTALGKKVGLTTSDGIYVGGRRIDDGDCSGPKSARVVLGHPLVEAAALETARGGILREGLGWDRADVVVVTNIGEGDHLGLNGLEHVEELAELKATLVKSVSPQGWAVLNATDPLTVAMSAVNPGGTIFFAPDPTAPVLAQHLASGGRAVFVRDRAVVIAEGALEELILPLSEIPLTMGGRIPFQVENVLAATAAAWGANVSLDAIRKGLASFVNDPSRVPARFNLLDFAGATVIVDYAHNVDACKAVIDGVAALPHRRRLVVFSAAGDRRDIDIERQAVMLGDAFDEVVLYEDACSRGRPDGECLGILRRGVDRGARVKVVHETRGELRAVELALKAVEPGDLLLVQADQIDLAISFIQRYIEENAAKKRLPTLTALPSLIGRERAALPLSNLGPR